MAFAIKDLALALHQDQGVVLVGARSCGNTQLPCNDLPFDHLKAAGDLKVLKEALKATLKKLP